jgi:hypothetical protein
MFDMVGKGYIGNSRYKEASDCVSSKEDWYSRAWYGMSTDSFCSN